MGKSLKVFTWPQIYYGSLWGGRIMTSSRLPVTNAMSNLGTLVAILITWFTCVVGSCVGCKWGPPACDAPAVINTEEISPLWLSALRRPEQLQKRSRQPLTGLSSVTRQIKPINGRTGLLVLAKCTPSYPFQFIPKASVWGCVKWYCVSHLIWALWAQSGPL